MIFLLSNVVFNHNVCGSIPVRHVRGRGRLQPEHSRLERHERHEHGRVCTLKLRESRVEVCRRLILTPKIEVTVMYCLQVLLSITTCAARS
jgi:hypothetical protein